MHGNQIQHIILLLLLHFYAVQDDQGRWFMKEVARL